MAKVAKEEVEVEVEANYAMGKPKLRLDKKCIKRA
jgi:hypothetical protein